MLQQQHVYKKKRTQGQQAMSPPWMTLRRRRPPPEDEDAEREYLTLSKEDHPQVTPGDDEYPPSQYNWDDEDDDTGSSFRANALSIPDMGYCIRKCHTVMCDRQVITTTCGPNHKSSNDIRLRVGVTTGGKPPLYDHCV